MKIFISGGCKNGKSYFAQRLAKAQQGDSLYYIATMEPADGEDQDRIRRHREERMGWGFETIECGRDIGAVANRVAPDASLLLDSLTALLSNEMFYKGGYFPQVYRKIGEELQILLNHCKNIVVVSDYIYSDAAIYDTYTEGYRKGLAYLDQIVCSHSQCVLEAVFSNIIVHKGGEAFNRFYERII